MTVLYLAATGSGPSPITSTCLKTVSPGRQSLVDVKSELNR